MATANDTTIAVVVTNHNYGRYVGEAIDSVLGQSRPADEIVVVDDGSTDGSRAILAAYRPRVTVIEQAHRGFCRALEAGIAATSTDIVQLLDADDVLEPTALDEVLTLFASRPEVVQVSFGRTTMSGDGVLRRSRPVRFSQGDVTPLLLRYSRYLCATTSGLSYRRDVLMGLMPLSGPADTADTYTTIGAAFAGSVAGIERPLYRYRIHGQNMQVGQSDIAALLRQRQATQECIARHGGAPPRHDYEMDALRSARGDHLSLIHRTSAFLGSVREVLHIEGLSVSGLLQLCSRAVMLFIPSQATPMVELGPGAWLRTRVRRR